MAVVAHGRRRARVDGQEGRPRAPRGADRRAVLEAVGERPGATAAELAAVSSVARNVLYGVLRRLVQEGEVQTRQLPTGRTGYVLGASQLGPA
jgi:predicted transcriptional regulator